MPTLKEAFNRFGIGLLVSCVLIIFFAGHAFADETEKVELTPELAVQLAQEFSDSLEPEKHLNAASPVKFYDEDGRALGYFVSYYTPLNSPSGFVVLDNSHKSLFAQWSFEEGCLSPLERGSFYNARMLSNEDDIKLIKIAPFTYSYVDTQ